MRDFMLRLPHDLHKKLKIIAATQGTSMTSYIIEDRKSTRLNLQSL